MNTLTKTDVTIILSIFGGLISIIVTLLKMQYFDMAMIISGLSIVILVFFTIWRRKKNNNKILKVVNFEKHGIFSSLKYYYHQKIPRFEGKSPLRTKLIKVALKIKFEVSYDKIHDFIQPNVDRNINSAKDMIMSIVDEYERQWKEENIPDIFVSKFYDYHQPKINILMEFIEDLGNDEIFDENSKTEALLNQLRVIFDWTMLDMSRLERELNGELTEELDRLHKENKF